MGRIHPKFDLKLVLKMGDAERGVLGRFTLRFTRGTAVSAQISKKRRIPKERFLRFIVGSPEGIRGNDNIRDQVRGQAG